MNTLKAEKRSLDVKAKRLRREGYVVGNVFGREMKESIPVKMVKRDVEKLLKTDHKGSQIMLDVDGAAYDVLIKNVDYNPVAGQIDSIEFQALVSNEKVHSVAEIVLVNHEKIAEGVLQEDLNEVAYMAYPASLVDQVMVDVGEMKIGDVIRVKDLSLAADPDITIKTNPESIVVSLMASHNVEALKDYFSSAISSFEKTDGKLTHKESKKFQQSVLKIINDHIQEKELTPRFIADHLAISVRSLYRKMEEMGEESPTIMIKECRLHVAKDLLLKTKKTIDEIVFEAGFSNKVTFFKVFREKYGCTPKEFRTKHLEEVQ